MPTIAFTRYNRIYMKVGERIEKPWQEWVELFSKHAVRGEPTDRLDAEKLEKHKRLGPAIFLGTAEENKRGKKRIEKITALGLDIENHPEAQVQAGLAALADWEWVAWTTHKHGSAAAGGNPRLRIIAPLAYPIGPGQFDLAWKIFNGMVGRLGDMGAADVSRLHYLPSTFDPAVAEAFHHEGKWISLNDLHENQPPTALPSMVCGSEFHALKKLLLNLPKVKVQHSARLLAQGKPFAEVGKRHTEVVALTWYIASQARGLSKDDLAALFGPSLDLMALGAPDAPTIDDVVEAYESAKVKLGEEEAGAQAQGKGRYTAAELEAIAQKQGWPVEDLTKRWSLQRSGATWFLGEDGDYHGPWGKDDLQSAAERYLGRAPVRLLGRDRQGHLKHIPVSEVVLESGGLIDKILADMTASFTRFDAKTGTLFEATTRIRSDLEPQFDTQIDAWLKLLGGKYYDRIVDWMSVCPDLTKLLCALYFVGAKQSGKNLFVTGLARLWTAGEPTPLDTVFESFNDALCRCPVVIADEEVARRIGSKSSTPKLRSMVSEYGRVLKRKFLPTAELRGAIRLILVGNNNLLLDSPGVSSAEDLAAVAQRFLHIDVSYDASKFLHMIPADTLAYWADRGIAEHALWLAENHSIKEPGKRFIVEGDVEAMRDKLISGDRWNTLVCEWLVRYLSNPRPVDASFLDGDQRTIRREGGELLVKSEAVIDKWEIYLKSREQPVARTVGVALRSISTGERVQRERSAYRRVDVRRLLAWAADNEVGDLERMKQNLITSVVEAEEPEVKRKHISFEGTDY